MKPANFGGAQNNRRIVALNNLVNHSLPYWNDRLMGVQLIGQSKEDVTIMEAEAPAQIKRVNAEIGVLKSRITSDDAAKARRTKKYSGGGGFTR